MNCYATMNCSGIPDGTRFVERRMMSLTGSWNQVVNKWALVSF